MNKDRRRLWVWLVGTYLVLALPIVGFAAFGFVRKGAPLPEVIRVSTFVLFWLPAVAVAIRGIWWIYAPLERIEAFPSVRRVLFWWRSGGDA